MLQAPRAVASIDYRVRGAEQVALSVRALTWLEEVAIHDREDGMPGYISAALLADGKQAFGTTREVLQLLEDEVAAIGRQVLEVLAAISPSYLRSDMDAWLTTLVTGARHATNIRTSIDISDTDDWIVGAKAVRIHRIERWFGLPANELTDGQRLAFKAACQVVSQLGSEK